MKNIYIIEKFDLLSKNQFGSRPVLGTENALYNVTRFINSALDEDKKVMAIFLDLVKAFDTVNHSELLNILLEFGIISSSLDWFKSYLNDRRQIVRINNFIDNEIVVNCGVPQCSVLVPILFILYINSVCNLKIEGLITTYADDTCLLFSGNSWVDVCIKAAEGLKRVVDLLNHKKYRFMKKRCFCT